MSTLGPILFHYHQVSLSHIYSVLRECRLRAGAIISVYLTVVNRNCLSVIGESVDV